MGQPREKGATPSAAPSRNFSLPAEERLRATAAGPPAHLRRLRAIEDLEARIVQLLAERDAEARAAHVDPDAYVHAHAPRRALERLADLIDRHNRFYPIEANLPIHPRSGELMDRGGAPWRPLPHRDLTYLLARARKRDG